MKPKFSLRDLFWLTLVFALAVGWWADRGQLDEWHRRRFDGLSRQVKEHLMPKYIPVGDFTIDDSGKEVQLLMPNGRPMKR